MNYTEIKKTLSLIKNPIDKLDMVMDLGNNLVKAPKTAVCTEIFGCASFVQICRDNDRFYGIADSAMVRGIVAIILAMVDGKNIDEIKKMDLAREFSSLHLSFGSVD